MSNTIIATNVMALNSHRSLTGVGNKLSKSSEKLSTGYRINRAADDAAGLAISEKMRSQIRGLDQATRNSQDGISLIQTAEGALQETENMLQKVRELTVQAANETNTDEDRDKIAGEVDELLDEIDATAAKTEFNTKKLIDGTWKKDTLYLQTGANSGQGLEFNIQEMNTTELEVTKGAISSVIRGSGVDGEMAFDAIVAASANDIKEEEMTGTFIFGEGATVEIAENGDVLVSGMKIDTATGDDANKRYTAKEIANMTGGITLVDKNGSSLAISQAGAITLTPAAGDAPTIPTVPDGDTGELVAGSVKITVAADGAAYAAATVAQYTYEFEDLTNVTFMDENGKKIDTLEAKKAYTGADIVAAGITQMVDANGTKFNLDASTGKIAAASEEGIGFIATNDLAKNAVENLAVTGQSSGKAISGLTEKIDSAIENVNSQRAKLGAYQNRLESTINNLTVSSENLSAAESRIRDTDMAKEMMNLTKANVLQQAATSMLAQANQAPQNVLKLLG